MAVLNTARFELSGASESLKCCGPYELSDLEVQGRSVWLASDGRDRALYCDIGGCWRISDRADAEKGADRGYLRLNGAASAFGPSELSGRPWTESKGSKSKTVKLTPVWEHGATISGFPEGHRAVRIALMGHLPPDVSDSSLVASMGGGAPPGFWEMLPEVLTVAGSMLTEAEADGDGEALEELNDEAESFVPPAARPFGALPSLCPVSSGLLMPHPT